MLLGLHATFAAPDGLVAMHYDLALEGEAEIVPVEEKTFEKIMPAEDLEILGGLIHFVML